jgi:hypothetical protein
MDSTCSDLTPSLASLAIDLAFYGIDFWITSDKTQCVPNIKAPFVSSFIDW